MAKQDLKELGFVREQNDESSEKEIEVPNGGGNALPGSQNPTSTPDWFSEVAKQTNQTNTQTNSFGSFDREKVGRDWSSVAERRQLRLFRSDDDDNFADAGAMTTVEEMIDDDDGFAVREGVNMEQQNRQEIEGLKVNLQMLADRLDADFAKNEGFEKETNAKFDFLQTQQDITFQGGNERFMEMSSELTEMTILQDKLQDKLKWLVTAVRGRDVIIEKLQADVKKNTRAVVALENSIQNLQMRITAREVETQHSSA
ncbi:hypothetical protein Sjap_009944 [Stephania japonica]|uniref:Uncharacterized protein n=1 Tax=Stephania japonica TaxID=461633 RepID=A0AAP0P375_9MAGN